LIAISLLAEYLHCFSHYCHYIIATLPLLAIDTPLLPLPLAIDYYAAIAIDIAAIIATLRFRFHSPFHYAT